MTLRWRLTLLYTALLSLLLLAVLVVVFSTTRSALERSADTDINTALEQVQRDINRPPSRGAFEASGPGSGPPRSDEATQSSFTLPSDMGYQIDAFGDETLESLRQREDVFPLFPEVSALKIGGFSEEREERGEGIRLTSAEYRTLVRQERIITEQMLEVFGQAKPFRVLAVLRNHKNYPGFNRPTLIAIYIVKDLSYTQRLLSQLQIIMLTASAYGVAGMAFLAYWLAGRALQPLRAVRKAAAGITEKSLGQRVPVPSTGDEVATLARTLNTMLERLERSFEIQRRFTSDASHELRTPVTAIGGHAGYLLRRTHPSEQQKESLSIIKNESERLSQLIASLLELARSDGGATPLNVQPMLALPFLEEIAAEFRPIAEASGARVSVTGPELDFEADPSRLKQVFINLIANALKAGSQRVYLETVPGEGTVQFKVADNGPGIASEHLPRLFDRFYRVDESRARDAGGSGLGLSIVKSIMDAHGGRIWVESTLGVGTVVHVELPCEVPESATEKRRGLRLPGLRRKGGQDTLEVNPRETGMKEGV